MSELSAAEKRVFGELAHKDAAGNIVEKAIGFVEKKVRDVVELTQHEFDVLVEKAKAWEQHVAEQAFGTEYPSDFEDEHEDVAADRELAEANQEAPAAALPSEG